MYDVNYETGAEQAVAEERREGDAHADYLDDVVYGPVPEDEP